MRFSLIALASALLLCSAPAEDKPKTNSIEIDIVPGALRYATTRFDATAGEKMALTLTNTCIMQHNWVLVQQGEAEAVVALAMGMATDGAAKNFIPETPKVLAATKIVNPGQSETLKFTVPKNPGEYPYLCTFPGHGTIMRGVLRVKAAGEKLEPPVVEKIDLHKPIDALKLSGVNPTPMGTRDHPFVMRSFVPNPKLDPAVLAHHDHGLPAPAYDVTKGVDLEGKTVGTIPGVPAGIAVSFGPNFAYVWDATECRLLYAWMGGFLDMTPYWGAGTGAGRRSRDYVPALVGTLVYKAAGVQPVQGGDPKQRPKFLGYRMLSGNPEFSYEIGGLKIHEHIMPTDPGTFMIHYRVENASEPVRLVFSQPLNQLISCEGGSWMSNVAEPTLAIPVDHADHFMLLVRFQPGETFKAEAAKKKGSTSEEP